MSSFWDVAAPISLTEVEFRKDCNPTFTWINNITKTIPQTKIIYWQRMCLRSLVSHVVANLIIGKGKERGGPMLY